MDSKKFSLISRRQALKSLAAITAGTLIKPTSLFATTARSKTRFAVMGDFGTGGSDEFTIARKMAELHREAPLEFVTQPYATSAVGLAGMHQRENAALAIAALRSGKI